MRYYSRNSSTNNSGKHNNVEVMGNFNQFLKVMGVLMAFFTIIFAIPVPPVTLDLPNLLVRIGGVSLLGVAALFIGALLGLVFGVPRSNRRNTSRPASTNIKSAFPTLPYGGNSNLEEISDWLTKMIVGIALINWRNISAKISSLNTELSAGLGGPFFGIMALGLIGAYLGIGFAMGYVWSRVFLPRLLSDAEQADLYAFNREQNISEHDGISDNSREVKASSPSHFQGGGTREFFRNPERPESAVEEKTVD